MHDAFTGCHDEARELTEAGARVLRVRCALLRLGERVPSMRKRTFTCDTEKVGDKSWRIVDDRCCIESARILHFLSFCSFTTTE